MHAEKFNTGQARRTHLGESRPQDGDEEPHVDEGEEVLAHGGVRHLEDGVAELEGGEEEGELGHLAEVVGGDAVPRGARLAPRAEAPRQRRVQPAQASRQNLGEGADRYHNFGANLCCTELGRGSLREIIPTASLWWRRAISRNLRLN